MKINYDRVADAVYFTIKKGKIVRTFPVNEYLNIDLDKNNKIIGVELLDASSKQGLELEENIKNGVPVEVISGTPIMV
ncbi:MAG TPA: DUF2283 domain-containing protein [Candidatus Paceibacterota bacterium]